MSFSNILDTAMNKVIGLYLLKISLDPDLKMGITRPIFTS